MSAFLFEYEQAKDEGVKFRWWTQPVGIVPSVNQAGIEEMECAHVQADASGTSRKWPVRDSQFLRYGDSGDRADAAA